MPDTVIAAENLSKLYRLGQSKERSDSFVGAVASSLWSPIRNFREISQLNVTRQVQKNDKEDASLLWALKDVSFEIKQGDVVGIIGRNGAGKSTLLKILSRVAEPSSGRVRMRGRLASLLEVGTGFHPQLSGRENIYLNGTILGMSKREIDRKFDEIVDFSGVERFLDTPVKRYSSGMKVRLGFAVAAHLEPDILIVDEVLAVGDVEFQNKCLGKMQEVTEHDGRTILFVSHNVSAVNRLCKRGIFMESGRVNLDGTAEDAVRAYLKTNDSEPRTHTTFPLQDDREAQFISASVLGVDGTVGLQHSCDDPITVRIECLARRPQSNTYLTVIVLNDEGTRIFLSDSRDVSPNPGQNLAAGSHRFEVTIPGRLLAPGNYLINIGWAKIQPFEHIDLQHSSCQFSLIDLSSHRTSRPGVLSIRLPWASLDAVASS